MGGNRQFLGNFRQPLATGDESQKKNPAPGNQSEAGLHQRPNDKPLMNIGNVLI
jgi:hypothetical protein